MGKRDSGKTAQDSDTHAGGNRMGEHEPAPGSRHDRAEGGKYRANEIVKRLKAERGEE